MPCDHVLELKHAMQGVTPMHDVKEVLNELSRSEASYARVIWTSGLSIRRIQVVISRGIGRYGYSNFMGTKVSGGELYVYKKANYDPVLLSSVCVGPMASYIAMYLREPDRYHAVLVDLGVFCRWFNRTKVQECIVASVIGRVGTAAVSVAGLTSNEIKTALYWMGVMQYNCYINASGDHLIITL